MTNSLEVGQQAPDFTLPSADGEINLREILATKRVVLAFYNEDNTST